jgi:ATP-binding protein involved in chromosome partitioning
LNVALALAGRGARVGLLDADFYGPDIPRMINVKRAAPAARWSLWQRTPPKLSPVDFRNIKVMSVGFLRGEDQSFPADAEMLPFVIRQLVYEGEIALPHVKQT